MKLVVFNFPVSDFIGNAKVLSMYRAKTISKNGGDANTLDTVLDSSDESFLKKYLKVGCSKIADVMSGYSKNILDQDGVMLLDPYEFDSSLEGQSGQIIFRINVPDSFVDTSVDSIDEAIRDGLENYMMYRTAKLRAVEFQSYQMDWETSLNDIRGYLSRRSETTKRSMNMF